MEQLEEKVAANCSKFPVKDEARILSETRVMVALDKVGGYYLKNEFRRDARCFPEIFFKCVLSTVACWSLVGQAISCSRSAIVIGDDHAPLKALHQAIGRAAGEGLD